MPQVQLISVKKRDHDAPVVSARREHVRYPGINMRDKGSAIVAEVQLPGIESKQLSVSVENDELQISGFREDATREPGLFDGGMNYWYEYFQESIPIPLNVEKEKVSAVFIDGELRITLPKCREQRSRRRAG
jgi:HSP20 family protein